ncbi:hypothetical protein BH20VER2_BH20VER2_12580 [soil metagenome]
MHLPESRADCATPPWPLCLARALRFTCGTILGACSILVAQAGQPESNRQMAERLAQIGQDYDRRLIAQRPDPHLARYLRHVDKEPEVRRDAFLQAKLAYENLLAGDSRTAAESFQKAKDAALAHPEEFDTNFLPIIRGYLAVSYLRMAEQANCCSMHGPQSCLLPIRGSGIHQDEEGSRLAIREYLELLEHNPGDLTSRWLLNVAYMTLGEHPEHVPQQWLIPAEKFASAAPFAQFTNVAPGSVLDLAGLAGGAVMDDFNGDGRPDLFISSSGLNGQRDQLRYFENNGDGTFTDRTSAAGLDGLIGGMNLLQADYDNDSHLDLLVLRGAGVLGELGDQPPSLLHNRGDGTFEDVTEKAGLMFAAPTQAGAWGDFDGDGLLDLFVGIESSVVAGFDVPLYQGLEQRAARPSKLFRNNGDGTFTDVATAAGLNLTGYIKGAAWGDVDNDGFPDLAIAQEYGPALLFHNRPAEGKAKPTRKFAAPLQLEPARSSSVVFFDYNQDGWLDLFIAGYAKKGSTYAAGQVAAAMLDQPHTGELSRLYRNKGARRAAESPFEDVTAAAGLNQPYVATGSTVGDFDNDGWPDLYLSTGALDYRAVVPKRMFRNVAGKHFTDVSASAGIAHLQKGSAVAIGDIDGDGDQDILQVLGGEYPGDNFPRALFLNPGNANKWLALQLEGKKSNRSAIGARIAVEVETPKGTRTIHAVVSTGGSYGGSTLTQEIGLGDATKIKTVQITWPSGTRQRVENLKPNTRHKIVESEDLSAR